MTDFVRTDPRIPALPQATEVQAAFDLVTETEAPAIAHHSIRSYLFASLIGDHRGAVPVRDYDPVALFMACALHDIGLTEAGNRGQRFEVDGADLAAEFLTVRGWDAADVDTVWEAIALHTSSGIAERRGAVCALTNAGVTADLGIGTEIIPEDTADAIHLAYPRGQVARALVDSIVSQATGNPGKAPPFSLTALFVSERATQPSSSLELLVRASRWGT